MTFRNGIVIAGITAAMTFVACGNGEDTPEDTPTETAAPATATATQEASTVSLTFRVDTSTMADGTNAMATVESGETVYIVGDFEGGCDFDNDPDGLCWKPQSANRAMTDEGSGVYAITIEGLVPGTVLNYKYTKTSDDPDDEWANGMKDYEATADRACAADTEGTGGGLWELNLGYTVPDADATLDTYEVEAWRNYAVALTSYPTCD